MARPTDLDDLTAQRVVNAIKSGLPRVHAARLAGVTPRTLFNWLRRGRDGEPVFVQFFQRVEQAEAHDVEELVGYMREHAKTSHQACAWLLERRYPKQFAAKKLADAGIAVTPDEARKLVEEAAKLAGGT